MFGEGLAELFPSGIRRNKEFLIRPGSYALVGTVLETVVTVYIVTIGYLMIKARRLSLVA